MTVSTVTGPTGRRFYGARRRGARRPDAARSRERARGRLRRASRPAAAPGRASRRSGPSRACGRTRRGAASGGTRCSVHIGCASRRCSSPGSAWPVRACALFRASPGYSSRRGGAREEGSKVWPLFAGIPAFPNPKRSLSSAHSRRRNLSPRVHCRDSRRCRHVPLRSLRLRHSAARAGRRTCLSQLR